MPSVSLRVHRAYIDRQIKFKLIMIEAKKEWNYEVSGRGRYLFPLEQNDEDDQLALKPAAFRRCYLYVWMEPCLPLLKRDITEV